MTWIKVPLRCPTCRKRRWLRRKIDRAELVKTIDTVNSAARSLGLLLAMSRVSRDEARSEAERWRDAYLARCSAPWVLPLESAESTRLPWEVTA